MTRRDVTAIVLEVPLFDASDEDPLPDPVGSESVVTAPPRTTKMGA